MKVYVTDPYDRHRALKGFLAQLMFMQSDIYEYMYYFAFKRSYKDYFEDFEKAFNSLAGDDEFFRHSNDRYAIHCVETRNKMNSFIETLAMWNSINIIDMMDEDFVVSDSQRYKPFFLQYKYSKSYKHLRLFYERTMISHINYLYKMACMFMTEKYMLPQKLTREFKYPYKTNLKLLNEDINLVSLIRGLIENLIDSLVDLQQLLRKPSQIKFD